MSSMVCCVAVSPDWTIPWEYKEEAHENSQKTYKTHRAAPRYRGIYKRLLRQGDVLEAMPESWAERSSELEWIFW